MALVDDQQFITYTTAFQAAQGNLASAQAAYLAAQQAYSYANDVFVAAIAAQEAAYQAVIQAQNDLSNYSVSGYLPVVQANVATDTAVPVVQTDIAS